MENREYKNTGQNQGKIIARRFLQILGDDQIILGICEFMLEQEANDSLDRMVTGQRHTERRAMLKYGGHALWLKIEDMNRLQRLLERFQRGDGAVPEHVGSQPSYALRGTTPYTVPAPASQYAQACADQRLPQTYTPHHAYRHFMPRYSFRAAGRRY